MTAAIKSITDKAKSIRIGSDRIKPGQPVCMSEAAVIGDAIRQGDLYIVVANDVPVGYSLKSNPSPQLVPGNTEGARHCLDSLDGVSVYLPQRLGKEESLAGPCLVMKSERTILHPTHGPVTIPAGFTVMCHYQREWDSELARERRNAD